MTRNRDIYGEDPEAAGYRRGYEQGKASERSAHEKGRALGRSEVLEALRERMAGDYASLVVLANLSEELEKFGKVLTSEERGRKPARRLINPAGRPVWFGTGCAARAMGIGDREVRAAREDQQERERQNVAKLADEKRRAEDARWQAFLNQAAGTDTDVRDWQGVCRFKQIQKLGGYAAARALFVGQS